MNNLTKVEYYRNCPICDTILNYKNKYYKNRADKKNQSCFKCSIKNRDYNGENNPFYGKKHTEEFKKGLSLERMGKHFSPETEWKKGQETANKTSIFEIWKLKYDEETYNRKVSDLRLLQSSLNSGEKNNMYGKPSPNGSGNGWSGWYKNWFFRSINELSYMINIIERFNISWENGEQSKYKIQYIDPLGSNRNYFSDFILDNKYMIECKPKRLWVSQIVISKKKYAEDFCKIHKLKYKLVFCKRLSIEELIKLRENKVIKFTDRYESKFIIYAKKNGFDI